MTSKTHQLPYIRRRCTIATKTAEPDRKTRLNAAKNFAIEAARLAASTRCHDVVVLDVSGVSPVTDYFVIATGTSARQMRTVIDEVDELGEKHNYSALARSGYDGDQWILVDFVDVLVHVFNDEARLYYDLDNLWADAKRVNWQPSEPAEPR